MCRLAIMSTFSMVLSNPAGNGTIRVAALNPSGSTYTFPSDFSFSVFRV
ncbi:MAG: hypothetical protein U0X76_11005 [Bacteroidia bacterium]